MSDSPEPTDTPITDDQPVRSRTRVRTRTPRDADPTEPDAGRDTPPTGTGRSRRPLVTNPFAIEPAPPSTLATTSPPADDRPETAHAAPEDEGDAPARRRRRSRGGRSRSRARATADPAATTDGSDDADEPVAVDEVEDAVVREGTDLLEVDGEDVEVIDVDEEDDEAAELESDEADGSDGSEEAESDGDDEEATGSSGRRRRRRGRRGRGRRGGARTTEPTEARKGDADGDAGEPAPAPTRLSARSQRTQDRRRGRQPSVSDETRRAIADSPPKRMLVTVGEERTQIAVLEERTLVEHYVTAKSEESYVGNIYRGRVQNVLPGMEAAFVDIGKGRNGVLYAGEVNYDEADLEGELPRIEQTLKSGQTVLVQVTKDPMGTKGARLTQRLSLAGRYCVLAPGDEMLGISRKLPDDERDRLRKILKAIKPEGFGLIVRTAAEGATQEQLEADVERLVERWKAVEERAAKAKALEPVYEEPPLVIRVIRDVFGPEHTQLIIDDAELAEQVREYLAEVAPDQVDKVVLYEGDDRLFDAYEVTTQIRRALEKKVWLKSGGYLIIEKTEAMWVIDVNTGKFVGKDNLEETVLKNNLEAAEEIARQLRLRDMGGIIVIDFVDMIVPANRDEVLKRFKRELARDKTKSRVMEISKLGLVQMTRKNVSQGLMESFTEPTDDAIPGRRIVEDLLA